VDADILIIPDTNILKKPMVQFCKEIVEESSVLDKTFEEFLIYLRKYFEDRLKTSDKNTEILMEENVLKEISSILGQLLNQLFHEPPKICGELLKYLNKEIMRERLESAKGKRRLKGFILRNGESKVFRILEKESRELAEMVKETLMSAERKYRLKPVDKYVILKAVLEFVQRKTANIKIYVLSKDEGLCNALREVVSRCKLDIDSKQIVTDYCRRDLWGFENLGNIRVLPEMWF